MKIVEKIILATINFDVFLLQKIFQKISNIFQKATGLTCFFLAKTSILITWATMTISFVAVPNANFFLHVFLFIGSLVYLLLAWLLISSWDEKEELLATKRVMNPSAIGGFPIRIMGWFVIIPIFVFAKGKALESYQVSLGYLKISYIFVVVYLYFASCTPLPPGKSLIKKLVDSLSKLFGRMTPVLCPADTPPKS